ncbi:MAG: hypothetical protein IPJ20_13545 [Flammeovirgaceae bacterium]|nr:hypothetical protein [Flammeovirgaceae bacterium]
MLAAITAKNYRLIKKWFTIPTKWGECVSYEIKEEIMKSKVIAIVLLILLGQSCSEESVDFSLKGTWIDSESLGFQFIEFYSDKQGRFGLFSKDTERYENFNYRLFDNKIAIDFEGDDAGETIHEISFDGKDKIEISGLTVIPENPTKIYARKSIITEIEDNEISLGVNDTYFDFENGYRLQARPIGESRCPIGAQCIWAGYASAQFNLIVDGNTEHMFGLATVYISPELKKDTLINGLRYTLLDITPYPNLSKKYKPEDYKVTVSIEK